MATISNTPRPGYVWDSTDNVWYPIGVGAHEHDNSSLQTQIDQKTGNAGGKNIIINGAMEIDQRTDGSSKLTTGDSQLNVDRWFISVSQNSKITAQRVADAPNGFTYSEKLTQTTAYTTPGNNDYAGLYQVVEANEWSRLGFGTPGASDITVSFWVKSSVTGTYGIGIREQATGTAAYVSAYTINSANTWEKKTVTIPGATIGTWATGNGTGAALYLALSMGSTYQGSAANTWLNTGAGSANAHTVPTISNTFWTTTGATWQVTGVQLEAGSSATVFSRFGGTYSGELAACQRYYFRITGGAGYQPVCNGFASSSTNVMGYIQYPVTMRTSPHGIEYSTLQCNDSTVGNVVSAVAFSGTEYGPSSATLNFTTSGMTTFRPVKVLQSNSASGYLALSAEL